jgi:hypothetical protein
MASGLPGFPVEYHDFTVVTNMGWPAGLGALRKFSQKAEKTSRDERLFKIAGCLSRAVAV